MRRRMNPFCRALTPNHGHWKTYCKGRSAACAGTLHANRSTVKFHQALHDRKSKAETAIRPGGGGIGLPEPFENMRKKLRLDTDTRIGHNDFNERVHSLQQHLDISTLGRELDRIGKQIPDDLLQTVGVA